MNVPIDITDIRIESDRLILRPWSMEDLEDFHEYNSIPGLGEMAGWAHHESLEESREVLEKFIAEANVFALELTENGKAIGSVSIDWLDPDPEMDYAQVIILGYDLHKDYWGRGLAPEAVASVIPYCFETLGADYLRCIVLVDNVQSQRVAEKCGFRFWKEWTFHTSRGTVEHYRIYLYPNPNRRQINECTH